MDFDYVGLKALLYKFMSTPCNSISTGEQLDTFLEIIREVVYEIWEDLENEFNEFNEFN